VTILSTGRDDSAGVEAPEPGQAAAAVEQTGIEKVGTRAAGLELELAEPQHARGDGEVEELSLVILHPSSSRMVVRQPCYDTCEKVAGMMLRS